MRISAATYFRPPANGKRRTGGAKHFRPFLARFRACCAFAFILSAFAFSACGKVGDPLPPIPRAPVVISELAAAQQGNQIILSFPLARTTRSAPLQRIDLYRLIEPASAPLALTEEDFSTRSTIIASIPAEQLPPQRATITYQDQLDLKTLPGNTRYRYAARLVNEEGRPAGFSNYALIAPLTELAEPPRELRAQLSQDQLELRWSPPAANESGTTPANVAGYNIYRRVGQSRVKLNPQPLTEPRYVDRAFQFDVPHEYSVRSLSRPATSASLAEAVESNESALLAITPKDTFAPSAPTSITIASINGIVSLFWPANPEPDVMGYNIYRAEDENAPPGSWLKLNAQLHTPTTFRDERVQVGKRYYYQITAVDAAGNESARSETKAEVVNP
jgi:hypothetical protein